MCIEINLCLCEKSLYQECRMFYLELTSTWRFVRKWAIEYYKRTV